MKKLFPFLFKLLLSILFTLILIEGGLRLFPDVVPLQLLIYFDEALRTEIALQRGLPTKWGTTMIERDDGGPELRTNQPLDRKPLTTGEVMTRDEMGFCNQTGTSQTPHTNIVAIGDSFTICFRGDRAKAWLGILGELAGASTYNLGKGGIGIHEYIQILKKFGLHQSHRVVILNTYEGNDFRDATAYYLYRLEQENAHASTDTNQNDAGNPNIQTLKSYSYAYNLGDSFVKNLAGVSPGTELEDSFFKTNFIKSKLSRVLPEEHHGIASDIDFGYTLEFPNETIPFNLENSDQDEVVFARLLHQNLIPETTAAVNKTIDEALKTFVALAKQHNFTPVVTYMPSAYTTYVEYVVFHDPSLTQVMPYFSQQQRRYFDEKSQELGYIFIDLTPELQAAAKTYGSQKLLYNQTDLHLTDTGHAVAGELIYQALIKKGVQLK